MHRFFSSLLGHEDGKGFFLKLDFILITRAGIVLREPLPPSRVLDGSGHSPEAYVNCRVRVCLAGKG